MSDTVKLVIEISKSAYEEMSKHGTDRVDYDIQQMINNGTPLDDVKAKIAERHDVHLGELKSRSNVGIMMFGGEAYDRGIKHAIEILDSVGEGDK